MIFVFCLPDLIFQWTKKNLKKCFKMWRLFSTQRSSNRSSYFPATKNKAPLSYSFSILTYMYFETKINVFSAFWNKIIFQNDWNKNETEYKKTLLRWRGRCSSGMYDLFTLINTYRYFSGPYLLKLKRIKFLKEI